MEKIEGRRVVTYYEPSKGPLGAGNNAIRRGSGHPVTTYFQLAKKVAELQFRNREYVLLFRGQKTDYRGSSGNSTLHASLFRSPGKKPIRRAVLAKRLDALAQAETLLLSRYNAERFLGIDRLKRYRILRWAILQHYEVVRTPLLDVTQSLRIAASFATLGNNTEQAYLYVFAVPNLSGGITASVEAGLQVVRLSSACPPEAVRPHVQEGYLLGQYPELLGFDQDPKPKMYQLDFGRRLIAKFRIETRTFWHSPNFPSAAKDALYPKEHRDRVLEVAADIRSMLSPVE